LVKSSKYCIGEKYGTDFNFNGFSKTVAQSWLRM